MVQKNDERQNKACQMGPEKNDKAGHCCCFAYQKKRLGEMLPNRHSTLYA